MALSYCPYCMSPIQPGQPCPSCGLTEGTYTPAAHHLPPGTVLGGRYLVGRVLGEGGFGITYIGCDLRLELRVAIKEYYPVDRVSRASARSLSVEKHSGSLGDSFEPGRDRFIQEARVMARMDKMPQIVGVRDFFQENNTAYIVMEYVDGTTLKELVAQRGGRLPAEELLPMVEPLFPALSAMHALGLIHRDISPDNIMLENGRARLLDFGCAREAAQGKNSMTVVLKHGYSPIEQYQHKGQGPWTDVYSLAATLYYCLTGKTPPQSLDRICDEELVPPSRLGADLTPAQERAILRGMGLRRTQRYATAEEFRAALYQGADIPPEPVMPGDVTVALEPQPIPAAPDPEPVMPDPEPAAPAPPVHTPPGPVMPGDLTVPLEPERVMPGDLTVALEPEPVMPEDAAAEREPELESEREKGKRRRERLGIFCGIAAPMLLLLLLWVVLRLWGRASSAAAAYREMVENIPNLTSETEIRAELEKLPEEKLFANAIHVTTEEEFLQHRKGNRPIVIDADIRIEATQDYDECTAPVLISSGVTVTISNYKVWDMDGAVLVNRGTLQCDTLFFWPFDQENPIVINYGDISCCQFEPRTTFINAGTVTCIGSYVGVRLVNLESLEIGANSSNTFFGRINNYGTITIGIDSTFEAKGSGRLENYGILDLRSMEMMRIQEGGDLSNYSTILYSSDAAYIAVYDGAEVYGVPEERIHRVQYDSPSAEPEKPISGQADPSAEPEKPTSGQADPSAEPEKPTSGQAGPSITWTLSDTGVLTFSGSGRMRSYDYDAPAPWKGRITSVVVEPEVASIGKFAFAYCDGLTSVTLPESVTAIGDSAFENCDSLTSITLPESVTIIGDSAFENCDSLTSITLPESVTIINNSAFEDCNGLTSITLPEGITTISSQMFYFCDNLTSVTLPAGVTTIDHGAFSWCSNLTTVYYGGTEEQWRSINIDDSNYELLHAQIHYNS